MPNDLLIPRRRYNTDGSRNIGCPQCGRFVGTVSNESASFGSAICAICDAANNGIVLPKEIVAELTDMTRTTDGIVVSKVVLNPPAAADPMIGKEPKTGLVDYYVKVVKSKVFKLATAVANAVDPDSKKLAKERKRRRVFDQEDLESAIPKEVDLKED